MQRDTLKPTDVNAPDHPTLDGSLVYRKSGLGAAQLATDHGKALSPRERQVLILVNGQRTIDELSDLLGAETVQRLIPDLEARGFAKVVDPEVPAEWAVTQLRLPAADARPRRAARDLREPRYPMAWIGLLIVLAGLGTGWAFHRFQAQIDSRSQFDSEQARSTEADGVSAATAPIDGKAPQHRVSAGATAITHRPPSVALEAAAVSPERVVRRGAPRAGETVAAATPDSPAPAAAAEPRKHVEAANPPPIVVAADAPRAAPDPPKSVRAADAPLAPPRPPTLAKPADPSRAPAEPQTSAKAVDASRAPAEPQTSAKAVDASRAPAELPSPAKPSDAPSVPTESSASTNAVDPSRSPAKPATPVKAADSPPSAPRTDVAMQVPAAQAGDAVKLRPLRHDPPQVPPKVVLNGVAEGHVRAHLWVTPEGKVDQVDIIEATPPRVLDDEVRRVLSLWTYEPPGHPSEDIVELTLRP
jgi:periplasmic protein TonB